jgi:hypothetical protein
MKSTKRYAFIGLAALAVTTRIPVLGPVLNLVCIIVLAVALIRRTPTIRLRWIAVAALATPYLPNAVAALVGLWIVGTVLHRITTRNTRSRIAKKGLSR